MKTVRTVQFKIRCGEETCAYEKGKFCPHFGTKKFGQIPVCCLFHSGGDSYTKLEEKDGWTQRCETCLKSEVNK